MQILDDEVSHLELIAPKRKVAISSAYLIPTGAIWKTLLIPSAIIVFSGLLNVLLTWGDQSRSAERLVVIGYMVLGFWSVHQVLMAFHQWNRRRWLQMITIHDANRFRLSSPELKNRLSLNSQTDPLALKRIGGFIGITLEEGASTNLPVFICLIIALIMFPFVRSYESFVWYIGILTIVVVLLSLFSYFAIQKSEVLITPVGILRTEEFTTEFYPWKSIEKVVWKEPRFNPAQLEIQRAKGAFSLFPGLCLSVERIPVEERERLIQYLSEWTSVKTLWVEEGDK